MIHVMSGLTRSAISGADCNLVPKECKREKGGHKSRYTHQNPIKTLA